MEGMISGIMSKIRGGGPHANAHADAKAEAASDSSALSQQKHNKKGTIDTLQNKVQSRPNGRLKIQSSVCEGRFFAAVTSRSASGCTAELVLCLLPLGPHRVFLKERERALKLTHEGPHNFHGSRGLCELHCEEENVEGTLWESPGSECP